MEHIRHHRQNSLLVDWLLIALALMVERLFRVRYLRRGTSTPMSSQSLVTMLWITPGTPRCRPHPADTG
jgi:hypothetical protein